MGRKSRQKRAADRRGRGAVPGRKSEAAGAPREERPALWSRIVRDRLTWAGAGLVALMLLAYSSSFANGYIWDDPEYLLNQPTLRSLEGLGEIWFGFDVKSLSPLRIKCATPQYYPLVFTSYWLEYRCWGFSPLGYHLVNIFVHVGSALLLWMLLRRLTVPGAWLAAALFALHPLQVESVAWITERKNVLSGFFYLAAFLCYLRWSLPRAGPEPAPPAEHSSPRWLYALALVFFVGALLSKTVTCTLPAAILVVLWWQRGRIGRRDIVPLIPFFAAGIIFGLLTVFMEKHHVGAQGEEWGFSLVERTLVAGRILWFYAAKLVLPLGLTFFYPRWEIDAAILWQYFFPAAALAVVIALWCLQRRLGRGPLAAVLFFGGTLFPALGFFDVYPMRFSFVADHFQYLACIGLIVLGAALFARAVERFDERRTQHAILACGGVLLLLVWLTWQQGKIYKDQETLWLDTLAKNPTAWIAHNNLGEIYVQQGQPERAIRHCREALALKSDLPEAQGNLANALYSTGRSEEAVTWYEALLRLQPDNVKAHGNLGVILDKLDRFEDAVEHFERAIALEPRYFSAYYNLGNAYYSRKKYNEAIEVYTAALRIAPGYVDGYVKLGNIHVESGRHDDAVRAYRRACQLNPGNLDASINLARLLATDSKRSMAEAREAVRLAEGVARVMSNNPRVLWILAASYARAGRFAEAVQTAERALNLARREQDSRLTLQIEQQLQLYRAGQPYLVE